MNISHISGNSGQQLNQNQITRYAPDVITTQKVGTMAANGVRWYVAVYELDRLFGGPEEGGWWYNAGDLIDLEDFITEGWAKARADMLRKDKYKDTGDLYSVLYSGGAYRIKVQNTKPDEHFPLETPRYE